MNKRLIFVYAGTPDSVWCLVSVVNIHECPCIYQLQNALIGYPAAQLVINITIYTAESAAPVQQTTIVIVQSEVTKNTKMTTDLIMVQSDKLFTLFLIFTVIAFNV